MTSRSTTVRRRPSAEVRALLISAARSLFSARGYEGTTTRDIAQAADVSVALLFSNFGSKENLFSVAVLTPFSELVSDYANLYTEQSSELTFEDRVRTFIERLYGLAQENRALLLSAIARQAISSSGPEAQIVDQLAQTFQGMQGSVPLNTTAASYQLDMPTSIAATTGMVLGVALLDPVVFPADISRPSRARLIDEMTAMIVDHARVSGGIQPASGPGKPLLA